MKKFNFKTFLAFLMTVSMLGFGQQVFAESALVINKDASSCGMLDGDGNFVFGETNIIVVTNSATNRVKFQCKFKGAPNSTGAAVMYNNANTGQSCGIVAGSFFASTTDWKETVSASGNITLTCFYND